MLIDPITHFLNQFIPAILKNPLSSKKTRFKDNSQVLKYGAKIHKMRQQNILLKDIQKALNISGVSSVYFRYKKRFLKNNK